MPGEITLSDVIGFGVGLATGNPLAGQAAREGVDLIAGFISGSQPSVGVTAAQAGLLSGGFAGPVTSTGTSVGPVVSPLPGINPTFGSFGGNIAPVVQRTVPILVPPAIDLARSFLERPGPTPSSTAVTVPIGPTTGSMRTMTRKQFILATARANNPGATAKKIVRSARECGIELAAATFGLDVVSVCFLIAQPPTRR